MGRGGSHALSPPLSFFFLVPPRLSVDGAVWLGAFDRTRVFRFFSQRVCSEKRACFRCLFSRGSVPLCGRLPRVESFRAISSARLPASPPFHLRPIYVVVSDGPARSYLGGGFVLRCFQHLSLPDADTRPCTWRYNR